MLNDRIWTISVVPRFAPSMIASAGTRPTSPSAVNELVIRPVAVLLWSSAVRPTPAVNAVNRFCSALARPRRQIRTESTENSAVDHMQAPQQQRHATHQVEKNQATHCSSVSLIGFEKSDYRQSTGDQSFCSRLDEDRGRSERGWTVCWLSPSDQAPGLSASGGGGQQVLCGGNAKTRFCRLFEQ